MSLLNSGSNRSLSVLSWNVRGLGDPDKCNVVRDAISSANPTVMCVQESKLHSIDQFKIKTFLPPQLACSYKYIPAVGSRGGIVTAWSQSYWSCSDFTLKNHSLTTLLVSTLSDHSLTVTNVYGPSDHRHSSDFLRELHDLSSNINGPWVIIGDFNLIRSGDEKNNVNVNIPLMNTFNDTINSLGVMEIPLLGRNFTWSNGQEPPILAKLDRALVNLAHTTTFPDTSLSPRAKPTSDHTPLFLSMSTSIPKSSVFRFENAWLPRQNFLQTVLPAWAEARVCSDAAGQLAACLKSARAATKVWARRFRAPRQIISNCKFIILLLVSFEEERALSFDELQARKTCIDCLAQAIKEKAAYWKQRSKFRAIREGDANTAFHHAQATVCLRNNTIRWVEVHGSVIANHDGKIQALTNFFSSIIGEPGTSAWNFDVHALFHDRQRPSSELIAPFSELEAFEALKSMDRSSAPGPDGFGPSFYRAAWSSIKSQVMAFLQAFQQRQVQLERINRSYMVLIPKKPGAVAVDAFRPICLQNCSIKILSKMLTRRLQKEIGNLIDLHQTGFLKGRSISETFVFAAELIQTCNKRRLPTLVLKLDFAKAFDTVIWESLDTILKARGFHDRWCAWMRDILSSSKSAVLVNGCPGPWITCKWGLRQGDPLSPYLFLLVADSLQAMIRSTATVRSPVDSDSPCAVL